MAKRNHKPTGRPRPLRALRGNKAAIGRVAIVAIAFLLCLIPVFFINNAMGYVPLLSLVFLILISYLYLRKLRTSLEFSESSLLGSCERGHSVELAVGFKNTSPLVFTRVEPHFYMTDLFGNIAGTMTSSMTLMPFEERTLRFDASFEHIGSYSAGLQKVVISDLLGLFSYTIENPRRHKINVMPHRYVVSGLALNNDSVKESKKALKPIISDSMDYSGVRDYVNGDPLKTIHWKLSARLQEGEYLTRIFESFGNPGISLVMDTTAPEYDNESLMQIFDGVVESVLAINDYAHKQGFESDLCFIDQRGQTITGRVMDIANSFNIIEEIPHVVSHTGEDAIDLYRRCYRGTNGQNNVALVTSHVNEEVVSALLGARMARRTPLLFVLVPRTLDGEAYAKFIRPLRQLDAAGIKYYVMNGAEDLVAEEVSAA